MNDIHATPHPTGYTQHVLPGAITPLCLCKLVYKLVKMFLTALSVIMAVIKAVIRI